MLRRSHSFASSLIPRAFLARATRLDKPSGRTNHMAREVLVNEVLVSVRTESTEELALPE